MRKRIIAVTVIGVLWAGAASSGPLEDGYAAYQRGDYETALKLLTPLAKRGDPIGQSYLAIAYLQGNGVTQDYAAALKLFRRAAAKNETSSQFYLGLMHENGWGVARDYVQAYMWFALATAGGRDVASSRDYVASMMTPDEIARAQQLALAWKPKAERDELAMDSRTTFKSQ